MSHTGKYNRPLVISILAIASGLFMAACSTPAEKLNQEGNQAFTEQAYLEALDLYQSAQFESPELAEPYFNAANTFYRQGDYPAALEQMQMALKYVDEASLAESSLFNLGNTLYNSQELNQAVESYTQALLLDPGDQDAKYNLELALQQLDQNQEQQEDSQNEEQSESEEQPGGGDESESEQEGQQGDQSQDSENQDQESQDEAGDQSQENDPQDEEQQGEGNGQPQQDEQTQEGDQPSQIPSPGQRMTEAQARQLLAALADNMESLQEHLGQYLFARQAPPVQDW